MKKLISEAKVDIESGIAKSLCGQNLNLSELLELEKLSTSDLMEKHEVDSLMAEIIRSHVGTQRQRLEFQNQYTGIEEYERIGGGYSKTFPFRESVKRKIKKIIRETINRS